MAAVQKPGLDFGQGCRDMLEFLIDDVLKRQAGHDLSDFMGKVLAEAAEAKVPLLVGGHFLFQAFQGGLDLGPMSRGDVAERRGLGAQLDHDPLDRRLGLQQLFEFRAENIANLVVQRLHFLVSAR